MSQKNENEFLGVVEVSKLMYQTGVIEPQIPIKDKYPVWDGSILVYSSEYRTNKTLIGKISVQVKGTKVDATKHQISVVDLKSYLNDGGVLFFNVDVKTNEIYYKALLPYDIKKYLKDINNSQETITVEFEYLDKTDIENVKNICRSFLINSRMQHSTVDYERKIEDFEKFIFKSPTFNFEDYMLKNPIYVYGQEHEDSVPIPVDKINPEEIINSINNKVGVGSKVYYDGYEVKRTLDEVLLKIGKGITIDLYNGKINFKVSGTLSERIKDVEFICDIIENKSCWIGDHRIFDGIDDVEGIDSEALNEYLGFLKDVKNLMDYFNVKEDLDMDNLTDNEISFLERLINKVLYKDEWELHDYFKERLSGNKLAYGHLEIGNINVTSILEENKNGEIIVKSFDKVESKFVKGVRDDKEFDASIYIILKADDFVRSSNINYEDLKDSIKKVSLTEDYAGAVTEIILKLIMAYDKDNNLEECLETALDLSEWLEENDKDNLVYNLNKLQILKRMRELNDDEKEYLISIKKMDDIKDENRIKAGVCLLLEQDDEFRYYFNKLSKEEQDFFKELPIYNLRKLK